MRKAGAVAILAVAMPFTLAFALMIAVVVLKVGDDKPAASGLQLAGDINPQAKLPGLPAGWQQYIPVIEGAAAQCKADQPLPAPVLAAQIYQESRFNPKAGSGAGALGIAQFLQSTWDGTDENGNPVGTPVGRDMDGDNPETKNGSPWDPDDAIPAQARHMCELFKSGLAHRSWDEPIKLALAGYNAGWQAVKNKKGIPHANKVRGDGRVSDYDQTWFYVIDILKAADAFGASGVTGKAVLPVTKPYTLTARFGSGGGRWSNRHTGQDFAVPVGTPVRSVMAGTVVTAGDGGAFGNQVVVRHSDKLFTQYAHLSALAVRPGTKVAAGGRLGLSGNTGNSSGPHLHFEVRTSAAFGSGFDPMPWLRQKSLQP